MNPLPPRSLTPEVARRIRDMEALEPVLLDARRKGYRFYRVFLDGEADVVVRFPPSRDLNTAEVVGLVTRILGPRQALLDLLAGKEFLATELFLNDLAEAGGDPAHTPGGDIPEGVPAPTQGTARPEPRDRAPSIPWKGGTVAHPVCRGGKPDCNGNTCALPKGHDGGHSKWGRPGNPCPACDPGRPCLDHGGVPEQVPPPMPGWMRAVCWALLGGLLGWVAALLLIASPVREP